MRRFAFALFAALPLAAAADPLEISRSALEDGLPQVAVAKITAAYPGAPDKTPLDAVVLLGRAYVESGRPEQARALLGKAGASRGRAGDFWLAQALADLGEPADALALYEACAADREFSLWQESAIGSARMLEAMGRRDESEQRLAEARQWPASGTRDLALLDLAARRLDRGEAGEALEVLAAVGEPGPALRVRRDFLLASAMAATGRNKEALDLFAQIRPLDPALAVSTVTQRAALLESAGDKAAAETLLEEFVDSHPQIEGLDRVFDRLVRIYSSKESPASTELKRWSDDSKPSLRRELALLQRARGELRLRRTDQAQRLLERLLAGNPSGRLRLEASLELAAARLDAGQPAEALKALPGPGASARADFLRGLALAATGDNSGAAAAFGSVIAEELREAALANAAVCEARAGTKDSPSLAALMKEFPNGAMLPRVRLAMALERAGKGDPAAASQLEDLAASQDPASGYAALALAEWSYAAGERDKADLQLRRVSSDADPDRQAALAVFLADTGDSSSVAAVEAAAFKFLNEHPDSPSEPNVRMKLGEVLYRKGDFAGARMQFESLARKYPGTPSEEPALFLAGQSASRMLSPVAADEALLLFEEVAAMNGTFAPKARFEQAVLQAAKGRPEEALVILDRVVSSTADADTRFAALMEKGKTLFLGGAADPAGYREAITAWRVIANDPAAPVLWKNQALARIGIAAEKLGEPDTAVAAFYEMQRPVEGKDPEYFWFYRSGFDAARILEAAQRWEEALKVYEILASGDGPRAAEARARINKIRLENFLWDGD